MKYDQDKFFIIVLSIVLGSVFIWFPIKHILISKGYMELQTTSNWVIYESKQTSTLGKIDDYIEQKKTGLQNRVTNYFPFYQSLNQAFYSVIINSNNLTYKNDFPIGLNSDQEYVFYNDEYDFYYIRNNRGESDLNYRVINQVNFFNSLYNSNKNVNLNIYLVPRYEQTSLPNNNLENYTKKFKELLDKNINVSELKINSIEEYTEKFYKTDHHWNMYGAYEGYQDIMKMLGKQPQSLEIKQVSNTKYYGSLAKSSLSKLTYDNIYDIILDTDYRTLVNNEENNAKFKPRKITYDKNYDFFDYYIHYFNGQYGTVQYTFNNNSTENLLIFSDSYAWQIDYLIASHYKNTYVINLRYDDYLSGKFDYNDFIEKNNITNVLFLYEGSSTIFDQFDYGFNTKIVRDK